MRGEEYAHEQTVFPVGAGCGLGSARCSRAGSRPTGGGFDRAGQNYAQDDVPRGEQAWSWSDVVSPVQP